MSASSSCCQESDFPPKLEPKQCSGRTEVLLVRDFPSWGELAIVVAIFMNIWDKRRLEFHRQRAYSQTKEFSWNFSFEPCATYLIFSIPSEWNNSFQTWQMLALKWPPIVSLGNVCGWLNILRWNTKWPKMNSSTTVWPWANFIASSSGRWDKYSLFI